MSLSNSLVRDGTARYFRWRRLAATTRHDKIPVTELTGRVKCVDLPDQFRDSIQSYLQCGCRVTRCSVYTHTSCKIGGKRFSVGEVLRVGRRCGSVVTMVSGGKSVYGLLKICYRVCCQCPSFVDFVVVNWFPHPSYPDGDPLTVTIGIGGLDIDNPTRLSVVPLYHIQPSRVAVGLDHDNDVMCMLRMEGTDTNPIFNS